MVKAFSGVPVSVAPACSGRRRRCFHGPAGYSAENLDCFALFGIRLICHRGKTILPGDIAAIHVVDQKRLICLSAPGKKGEHKGGA